MPSINDIVLTDELIAKYKKRHITDEGTIRSFEYIKAQPDARLQQIIECEGPVSWNDEEVAKLAKELKPDGGFINHNWIISQVGEELYMRDILEEDDWLYLQDKV